MLLCTDVGNTNIKFAFYDGEKQILKTKVSTDPAKTDDEFAVELYTIIKINGVDKSKIDGSILSSVVPKVTEALCKAIKTITGVETMVLNHKFRTDMEVLIDNPASLGTDLLAMCVGAKALYPCPCTVISLGTATTIVRVDGEGRYRGGCIAPGVSISLDALTSRGALLPSIQLNAPEKSVSTNTEDCIRGGIVFGTACMLDGMTARFDAETGEKATVIATGGLAQKIVPNCSRDIIINDDLVLEGLRIIYSLNK